MWPKPNLFTALSVVHAPLIHTGETPFKDPTHLWAYVTLWAPAQVWQPVGHVLQCMPLDGLSLMVCQYGRNF